MAVNVGEVLELEVTKVVHGGDGLARHDGFVIFVHGGLPHERVRAEVYSVKKSHAFAELVEVVTPSSQRVSHIWPEADVSRPPATRAGGADYGHIDISYQRALKTGILREALTRHGGIDEARVENLRVEALPGDADGLHWRTRVTLHVGSDGRAGPYAERSHQVIPVSTLPLATEAIESLGVHTTDWAGHQQVRVVHTSSGEPRVIIDQQRPTEIIETVGQREFVLSDQSFWQVHHRAAPTLHQAVGDALSRVDVDPAATHLDLYGGVGLFADVVGSHFGDQAPILVVESDPLAAGYTQRNLTPYAGAVAVTEEVKGFLSHYRPDGAVGAVILDPPRSGAKDEVVRRVAALSPQAIVYVACDPVALGRDLRTFREHGYELENVRGFDLFPHTHHLEAVALLVPASA